MIDRSRLIEKFLEELREELDRFVRWVAIPESRDDPRGDFILDTKDALNAGGDPAREVRSHGLPHVSGPLRGLTGARQPG